MYYTSAVPTWPQLRKWGIVAWPWVAGMAKGYARVQKLGWVVDVSRKRLVQGAPVQYDCPAILVLYRRDPVKQLYEGGMVARRRSMEQDWFVVEDAASSLWHNEVRKQGIGQGSPLPGSNLYAALREPTPDSTVHTVDMANATKAVLFNVAIKPRLGAVSTAAWPGIDPTCMVPSYLLALRSPPNGLWKCRTPRCGTHCQGTDYDSFRTADRSFFVAASGMRSPGKRSRPNPLAKGSSACSFRQAGAVSG